MTNRTRNSGFSLIELMVGMLIAILASIVVYQVFAVSERQKRTTTGASDAQSNGAIAFYMVERDVKMAGWGLENTAAANCGATYSYYEDGSLDCSTNDCSISNLFSSVTIKDGGAGPDSISIRYFGNPDDTNYILPSLTTLRSTMPQSSSELNVNSTYGCEEGGLALVMQGGNCTLMQITQLQPEALKLQHNPGNTPTYNPTIVYQKDKGWPAYSTGAMLQCMSNITNRTYCINNDRSLVLSQSTNCLPNSPALAPEIIDIQAEYGIAVVGSQQVINQILPAPNSSGWTPATGVWAGPLSTTDSYRIKAIRIALVARSSQYEKPDVSGVCTTTSDAMAGSWSSWAAFNTANYPADWKCYRYKVFETVIPIRNVIWANV